MPRDKKETFDAPELFVNRELSWLEFNRRVLRQGFNEHLPALERLKFFAIFSANLDEFFMVRVAGLMQQRAAGVRRKDKSGMTPRRQLGEIGRIAHELVRECDRGIRELLDELRESGLLILKRTEWNREQRAYLRRLFRNEILPILTPMGMSELSPKPLIPSLQLNMAFTLAGGGDADAEDDRIMVVPVPGLFGRFLPLPPGEQAALATVEDVIADNIDLLCPEETIRSVDLFRVTRDADVEVQEDEAGDLLGSMEEAVLQRRRRAAVRLELSAGPSRKLKSWLVDELGLSPVDIYRTEGIIDPGCLWEIVGQRGFEDLKVSEWSPAEPRDLAGFDSVWEAVADHDVMLFHPYESFEPVVRLLQEAADDPGVLAIKQTLYRTSGDSPIIAALERAARNGKEVTVLVELKARFDEARNIQWARRLEDAGCHVIYGVVGLKTHAKALMIVRREENLIRRYVHLGTGNYNDKTARIYSDIGIMTCDNEIGRDVSSFFNLLTGLSESVGWSRLTIAPTGLRKRFVELIDREIRASTPDRPGLIIAKVNSLEDRGMCTALYRAAGQGVNVRLNVRGICCLRPGIEGVSDNIEVISILDRFLEHARIFYFNNGGHPEVYLGSADWMGRNLDKRLEILFPVVSGTLVQRVREILDTFMADNVQAWVMQSDGTWEPRRGGTERIRAQELFHRRAESGAADSRRASGRFRPITHPREE